MPNNLTVDWIDFARGVEQLIGDIPEKCRDKVEDAISDTTKDTAKKLRTTLTEGIGKHPWSKEYRSGFRSKVTRGWDMSGEIGNRRKPGLVHLLEKGHLTPAGRRTNAYPHMAPAFDEMQKEFVEEVQKAIGKALEG